MAISVNKGLVRSQENSARDVRAVAGSKNDCLALRAALLLSSDAEPWL